MTALILISKSGCCATGWRAKASIPRNSKGYPMSDTIRQQAQADIKEIEAVTTTLLPPAATEIVPLATAEPQIAEEIRRRIDEIDMRDSNSIVAFGAGSQIGIQEISQTMLADVRNKEVGPAGDS